MSTIIEAVNIQKRYGSYTIVTGILLTLLGAAGIILPTVMSLGTDYFIATLLIVGGILWALHTLKYSPTHVMDWLKPLLLLMIGGLMLVYPITGLATIGLLLSVYLLLDAYGSFMLGQSMHPNKGWGWMIFNGVTSLVLAILFLVGWPENSLWLVGLYIAISLFFDGTALTAFGWTLRHLKNRS